MDLDQITQRRIRGLVGRVIEVMLATDDRPESTDELHFPFNTYPIANELNPHLLWQPKE